MANNSLHMNWIGKIEKALKSLFSCFDNLCNECAKATIENIRNGERNNIEHWCCCMIDNQVHDHWEILDEMQSKFNRRWYAKIKSQKKFLPKKSLPNNGPCPALGPNGCLLRSHRPITCSTQLCEKMIFILREMEVIETKDLRNPVQIEDIISLPDILPTLYGMRQSKKRVGAEEVDTYIRGIARLRTRLEGLDDQKKSETLKKSVRIFLKGGGKGHGAV